MEADREKPSSKICLPFLTQRPKQRWRMGIPFHTRKAALKPTCLLGTARVRECVDPRTRDGCQSVDCRFLERLNLPTVHGPQRRGPGSGCWVTSLAAGSCSGPTEFSGAAPRAEVAMRRLARDTRPWRRLLRGFPRSRPAPVNRSYHGWGWTSGTASWVEPTSFPSSSGTSFRDHVPPEASRP